MYAHFAFINKGRQMRSLTERVFSFVVILKLKIEAQ
jgi:hypothetical protein